MHSHVPFGMIYVQVIHDIFCLEREATVKKRTYIFIVVILVVLIVSALLYVKHKNDMLFAEEIQKLQEKYPLYFCLDTSEGLNVLVYGDDKIDFWSIRLVSGNKDYYSIYEDVVAGKTYEPLSLEDAKLILEYYDLPDEMVILHPYDNWLISSFKLSHLLEDETYLTRMAEAFDSRYQVGEEFPVIYVPEIDGYPPEE